MVEEALKKNGSVGHGQDEPLKVALGGEYVDGQTDAGDRLSRHQVFGYFSQNKLEDSLLVLYFFLVDEDEASFLVVVDPLVLPERMQPVLTLYDVLGDIFQRS